LRDDLRRGASSSFEGPNQSVLAAMLWCRELKTACGEKGKVKSKATSREGYRQIAATDC